MTVVVGMRFSPKSGIVVADEQGTDFTLNLKSINADKIYDDGAQPLPGLVIGVSGALYATRKVVLEYTTGSERGPEAFNSVVHAVKKTLLDDYIRSKYHVGPEAFRTGRDVNGLEINRNLMERLERVYDSNGGEINGAVNNSFLLLEPENMRLWSSSMLDVSLFPVSSPSRSIGSGASAAQMTLDEFYGRIPRENRENLTFTKGLQGAVTAVAKASLHHNGVEGTPNMAIVKDGAFYRPTHRNSRLIGEIVGATNEGLVAGGFADSVLEDLVFDATCFDTVEREFKRAATDSRALDLFLRGYPVYDRQESGSEAAIE